MLFRSPIVYGSCKLLDMLGYGSMIDSKNTGKAAITKKYLGVDILGDADNPLVYQSSQTVNALPFLVYQKIYYDFFSNNQWEKHKAYAYNVDYWSGTGNVFVFRHRSSRILVFLHPYGCYTIRMLSSF